MKRISKWRRPQIEKLMEMAGWTSRLGTEGHIILSKERELNIALGTDPVHLNAIAEVERALGIHIEKVIRRPRGSNTVNKNQLRIRLTLAKQMDIAGFDSKKIKKQCSLTSLYSHGFSKRSLRVRDPIEYADELYARITAKKKANGKSKVQSQPGQGRIPIPIPPYIPSQEEAELIKPPLPSKDEKLKETPDDMSTILDLLASIERKINNIPEDDGLKEEYRKRLQTAFLLTQHIKLIMKMFNEIIEELASSLEEE